MLSFEDAVNTVHAEYYRCWAQLRESISFKAKGIDGPYTGKA